MANNPESSRLSQASSTLTRFHFKRHYICYIYCTPGTHTTPFKNAADPVIVWKLQGCVLVWTGRNGYLWKRWRRETAFASWLGLISPDVSFLFRDDLSVLHVVVACSVCNSSISMTHKLWFRFQVSSSSTGGNNYLLIPSVLFVALSSEQKEAKTLLLWNSLTNFKLERHPQSSSRIQKKNDMSLPQICSHSDSCKTEAFSLKVLREGANPTVRNTQW